MQGQLEAPQPLRRPDEAPTLSLPERALEREGDLVGASS